MFKLESKSKNFQKIISLIDYVTENPKRDDYLKAGFITPKIYDTFLGDETIDFMKVILASQKADVDHLSIEQASKKPTNTHKTV